MKEIAGFLDVSEETVGFHKHPSNNRSTLRATT